MAMLIFQEYALKQKAYVLIPTLLDEAINTKLTQVLRGKIGGRETQRLFVK
jgi:hypothetical protein